MNTCTKHKLRLNIQKILGPCNRAVWTGPGSCAHGKLPMYSLNARDHFNCSPLLLSWPAPRNICGQTEGVLHLEHTPGKLSQCINYITWKLFCSGAHSRTLYCGGPSSNDDYLGHLKNYDWLIVWLIDPRTLNNDSVKELFPNWKGQRFRYTSYIGLICILNCIIIIIY